jgi:predicted Zn-dependent protease with MMP-like domain
MAARSDDPLAEVWLAYKEARVADCIRLGEAAVAEHPGVGGAWFVLGCAYERAGRLIAADKAFAKGSRCTDDPVGTPYRVTWSGFQQVVAGAIDALPPKLKDALGDVTLILADYAEPELLETFDDSELLGLFLGPVRAQRDEYPEVSPTIHVFRRAHEHSCATSKEFRQEVKQTLYHEFGHYLGFGEEDLDQLGMA